MNNEQQQIIDEVYDFYCKSFEKQSIIEQYSFDTDPMTKVMFVLKIKTDNEFSQKWGIQIEERELSQDERIKLYEEKTNADTSFFPVLSETLVFHNISTKLITITYKENKIEIYE